MLAKCPICGRDGSLQQRYSSVRVGHYKGWKGKTRIIEWHSTSIQSVLMVNRTKIGLDEHGKLYLFTKPLDEDHEKDHCLPKRQIMSPANFNEIRVWRPSQARLPRHILEPNRDSYAWRPQIQIPASKEFCLGLFKSLIMSQVDGSIPNPEKVLLDSFEQYLKGKVSPKVRYEYMRVVKHFLKEVYGLRMWLEDPQFVQKLKDFLAIENPYTYRNTLAALKHLFTFLGIADYLKDFKFKASMPNFNIATPSFEDMLKFHDAIENERIRFFFELGTVSAIRPEHLRLIKKLFDKPNRMINTWQKTFGKKNFFFSFYTENLARADTLPKADSQLFPLTSRCIQKEFVRASEKSGVRITPKMLRKFATNWLRRHGMISEDVDAMTSHLPYSVVARHYLDHSRIKAEYDNAMKEIILSFDLEDSKSFLVESQIQKEKVKA